MRSPCTTSKGPRPSPPPERLTVLETQSPPGSAAWSWGSTGKGGEGGAAAGLQLHQLRDACLAGAPGNHTRAAQ